MKKEKLFLFMKAFRETFSRPVTRIKFMGLFDTVNSVPSFESAWMQRSKFPYTARSSARVIRHAVGIDERRAKFRQDLISGAKPQAKKSKSRHAWQNLQHHLHLEKSQEDVPAIVVDDATNGASQATPNQRNHNKSTPMRCPSHTSHAASSSNNNENHRYRAPATHLKPRRNLAIPTAASAEDLVSLKSELSGLSLQIPIEDDEEQDIQEVWFPGCHADIGGGWKLEKGEKWPLSHPPLVWMVQEAWRAGLQLDPRKVKQFECMEEFDGEFSPIRENGWNEDIENGSAGVRLAGSCGDEKERSPSSRNFHAALHLGSTKGWIHDCLSFGNGLPAASVITWRLMEYLPFRRMDLQPDGSWKPIRWPLPCGEVRDIPLDAQVHISAIHRMEADPDYRPGNLIVGGGGRGVRKAPAEIGMGEWVVKDHEGDPVRQVFVRKSVSKCQENHQ